MGMERGKQREGMRETGGKGEGRK